MAILREDLFVAFFSAARSPNLACLSGVCQVALSLYAHLGSHLLLQVGTHVTLLQDLRVARILPCLKAFFAL